jgi:hypothetical protein
MIGRANPEFPDRRRTGGATPPTGASKWERAHEPWCAFQISVNNGGPLFSRCDCVKKPPRPPKPLPLFDRE